MSRSVLSAKVRGLLSRWFKSDLECMLNLNKIVILAKEWETSLDREESVRLVKVGRLSRREWIFKSQFLRVHLQVTP